MNGKITIRNARLSDLTDDNVIIHWEPPSTAETGTVTTTTTGASGEADDDGSNAALAGDDSLYGTDAADALNGGDGDDYLNGGDGDDRLIGGSGIDRIYGSAGDDTLIGGTGFNGSEGDLLNGGAGDDVLYAQSQTDQSETDPNRLYGDVGNDRLIGAAGADLLHGGAGVDTVDYSGASSGATINLDGGSGSGAAAGDRYYEIENVIGTDFDDVLIGNASDNLLAGGDGNDTFTGNGGADSFILAPADIDQTDRITDFELGIDKIDLTAYELSSYEDLLSHGTQIGDTVQFTLIKDGRTSILQIEGVELTALSGDSFDI
ncbi:MAG: M10 family metallopeptidase C-terminal domain-containing protein [Neomegalonema sp.]|nr:M10 family metallopeptidase C-terminal domain-containing protein [Neomegalonema sp.]